MYYIFVNVQQGKISLEYLFVFIDNLLGNAITSAINKYKRTIFKAKTLML
jgi:hypothetical protein